VSVHIIDIIVIKDITLVRFSAHCGVDCFRICLRTKYTDHPPPQSKVFHVGIYALDPCLPTYTSRYAITRLSILFIVTSSLRCFYVPHVSKPWWHDDDMSTILMSIFLQLNEDVTKYLWFYDDERVTRFSYLMYVLLLL